MQTHTHTHSLLSKRKGNKEKDILAIKGNNSQNGHIKINENPSGLEGQFPSVKRSEGKVGISENKSLGS